jgi:hypothetical protein
MVRLALGTNSFDAELPGTNDDVLLPCNARRERQTANHNPANQFHILPVFDPLFDHSDFSESLVPEISRKSGGKAKCGLAVRIRCSSSPCDEHRHRSHRQSCISPARIARRKPDKSQPVARRNPESRNPIRDVLEDAFRLSPNHSGTPTTGLGCLTPSRRTEGRAVRSSALRQALKNQIKTITVAIRRPSLQGAALFKRRHRRRRPQAAAP